MEGVAMLNSVVLFLLGFLAFPVVLVAHGLWRRRRRLIPDVIPDDLNLTEEDWEEDTEEEEQENPFGAHGAMIVDLDRQIVQCLGGMTPPEQIMIVHNGEEWTLAMDYDRDPEFYGTMPGGDA